MDLTTEVRKKMMDLLARREHSEHELREKLEAHFCQNEDGDEKASEAIDAALQHARLKNWLPDPQELAMEVAEQLRRKGKGAAYINQYLEQKGLPFVSSSDENELEKAQELVKTKYRDISDEKTKHQAARFLASRGFDEEIVRKVVYEEF